MPQGTVKFSTAKPKAKALHSQKQKQKNPSHKIIKPKDANKARAREMTRKGAAGLSSNLEKMLAERAGHTEMINAKKSKTQGTGLGNAGKSSANMGFGKKVLGKK